MHELVDQVVSQLRAIWRHRWYGVVIAWVIAIAGWSFVYAKPDIYEASTRVFVDTQSVLRPLMTGLAVQPDLDEMVAVMSQTLISRPNLERVIQMTELGNGTDANQEAAIVLLANNLSIRSAGRANLYKISFEHEDPRLAKSVVEAILRIFVDRSLGDKREDADSARKFIDEQLEGYRDRLNASENAIMAFKRKHLGLLPGEGQSYFARLVETQTALSKAELALKEAENSASSIRRQQEIAKSSLAVPDNKNNPGSKPVEPVSELDVRIGALERKLDELRLSYTEQHPDIVALLPMIAQLKARKDAEDRLKRQREAEALAKGEIPDTMRVPNPVHQELTVALSKAESEVAILRTRVAEYRRRYAELQAGANLIPQVEAEFTQLTRDYEVNKARYEELLKRRESAQISGDLEETDAVMGFRVVDPPRLPLAPVGPNDLILVTLVLFVAVFGGIGGAWIVEQLNPTIRDERGLREASGLKVLGTVVLSSTERQNRRRRWGILAFLASFASLLSAYVAIVASLFLAVSRV
jgi:protein tyrosine kinase modulator